MNKTKRIFYYDVLRAIAIIGIVFCHVSSQFVANPSSLSYTSYWISAFFDCFRDFSIPVFVMLSGALLIGKKDTLITFFKKRLSRIFIPFVFWVVIYRIYSYFYFPGAQNTFLNIFFGTPGTLGAAFWFIWMITVSYIGIFIINKVIIFQNNNERFNRYFIPALLFLSIGYIIISQFGLFNPYQSRLIYFISFMSYIVIGYALANYNVVSHRFNNNLLLSATGIIFMVSYLYYISFNVVPSSILNNHFSYSGYFNLLTLIMSASLFLFFKYLSNSKFLDDLEKNNMGKIITCISGYSFGIYLSHFLIMYRVRMNLVRYVQYTTQSPLFWIPFLVLLILAISMVILLILDRIPVLEKFSGNN